MTILSKEHLQKMSTKSLLRYYKAERKRFYIHQNNCKPYYEADYYMWESGVVSESALRMKSLFEDYQQRLEYIKTLLSNREHVKR